MRPELLLSAVEVAELLEDNKRLRAVVAVAAAFMERHGAILPALKLPASRINEAVHVRRQAKLLRLAVQPAKEKQ